jgi:hypothetical protein
MSEPDNFVARWARRKRQVAEAEKPDIENDATTQASDAAPARASTPHAESTRADNPVTPFDLSTLPSIDSITADTDIRCFFAPGVPETLSRAALRRAWAVDPHVRDFVGLEENAWDFNNPDSIPGFGALEMTDDLRREVARIIGDLLPEDERPAGVAPPDVQPYEPVQEFSADRPEAKSVVRPPEQSETTGSGNQKERQYSDELAAASVSNTAVQQSAALSESVQAPAKRSHGSALPK